MALFNFTVVGANNTQAVDAFRSDAVRLYACDPADANTQLSPNGAASAAFLRLQGRSRTQNLTRSRAALEAFGVPNATADAILQDPSQLEPAVVDGDASIAVCGSLGLGAYTNTATAAPAQTPVLRVAVHVTVVEISADGSTVQPVASLAQTTMMELRPAAAITAELDEASIWCRAAGASSLASHQRLRARVTQQLPPMRLRFFDPWGNPAVTELADTATVRFHVPLPHIDLSSTSLDSPVPVPAGSSTVVVPSAAILGRLNTPATAAQPELDVTLAASPTGQLLTRSMLDMQRVAQGGRTFRTCGELFLLSGYPQALTVEPAPGVPNHVESDPALAQLNFVVAIDPNRLDQGVNLRVTPRDSAGNPVAVAGGSLPPCTGFGQSGCVACGIPVANVYFLLPAATPTVNDTIATTTWFRLTPATDTAVQDVQCWLQPGFTGSSRVVNASESENAAASEWAAATVRTAATFRFKPVGDYACYDATTPLADEMTPANVRSLNKVFQNPVLDFIPFTTMRVAMRSAGGGRILRDPDADRNDATPPLGDHPLSEWIIVPRKGFVDIPLGLMSVLAYGSTYSRTSSVFVNITRPICDNTDFRAMERAISTWLYQIGDNATVYYEEKQPTVDSANTIDIDLRVCYGNGLESLEFVTTECCNRQGFCGTTDTKSILAYVLLVGATFVALLVALATSSYVSRAVKTSPVHLTPRFNLDVAEKTRVVLAHLLAPWMILAHMYFTFEVQNTPAAVLWYVDIAVCATWPMGLAVRAFFPLHNFAKPVYYAVGNLILTYSQFLMANAVIWMLAALNLSVQLLPFCAALVLVMVQVFWAVLWAQEQLGPGVLSDEIPSHSIVPVDAALGVEYFAIIATLFMFAVGQVEDLSAFSAVVAAVVITLFFWVYNFSVSAQLSAALKKHLGGTSEEQKGSGGSIGPAAQRRQMLQRVMSFGGPAARQGAAGGGGPGGAGGADAPYLGQAGRQQSQAGDFLSALQDHLGAPLLSNHRGLGHDEEDEEEEMAPYPPPGLGEASPLKKSRTVASMEEQGSVNVTFGDDSPPSSRRDHSADQHAVVAIPQPRGVQRASDLAGKRTPAPRRKKSVDTSSHGAANATGEQHAAASDQLVVMSPRAEQRLQELATERALDQMSKDGLI